MLQFTNDTIFFLRRFEDVALKVCHVLTIFSTISGLFINLSKRSVLGIGIDSAFAVEIAIELHCRYGPLPFNYLGLPIGGRLVDGKLIISF